MPNLYTIQDYIRATLDKAYTAVTHAMFLQIAALSVGQGSEMQRALIAFDVEAQRLTDLGKRMTPDNAALLKVIEVNERQLVTAQSLIMANGAAIKESGQAVAIPAFAAKLFPAVANLLLGSGKNPVGVGTIKDYIRVLTEQGVSFSAPDVLDFADRYISSEAWIARMEGWGTGYSGLIGETIKKGINSGWSPIRTARELRKYAENLPKSASENITRTLQLASYRDAAAAMEVLNGQYIERKIRIASLDDRCCLSCVSLHGTEIPIGEPVSDHYRGRCDSILVPVGGSMPTTMQADSMPGQRNFVPWQTGEEWFASLPADRQAQQASFLKSPAKLRAYQDGTPLSAFTKTHEDSVFGTQIVENSLVGALGGQAGQYYDASQ